MKLVFWPKAATPPVSLTPQTFQEVVGVRFLPSLEFSSQKVLDRIENLCLDAQENGEIETKEAWLGAYFQHDLDRELPRLDIRWIDEEMGYGLFAAEKLPKGTFLGVYTGTVRSIWQWNRTQTEYWFLYPTGEGLLHRFVIDAERQGNHTRFMNHSDHPNLLVASALLGGILQILFYTEREIQPGEELTYNYGIDYWKRRKKRIESSPSL